MFSCDVFILPRIIFLWHWLSIKRFVSYQGIIFLGNYLHCYIWFSLKNIFFCDTDFNVAFVFNQRMIVLWHWLNYGTCNLYGGTIFLWLRLKIMIFIFYCDHSKAEDEVFIFALFHLILWSFMQVFHNWRMTKILTFKALILKINKTLTGAIMCLLMS